jgi:hypothetical protein
MTEPAPVSFSLLAGAIALFGPVLGPYALIVFAAGVGAAIALSVEGTTDRWEGFKFWLLATGLALCLTSPVAWAVEHYTNIPANVALIPVAWVLGMARNHIVSIVKTLLDAIAARVRGFIDSAANVGGGGK